MEDGIAFLAEGAECEGDGASAQLDVTCLAHDTVGIWDDKIRESAMVFFEPFRAFCVWLAQHLRAEIGKLLAELFNLGLCLEVLESATDSRIGEADSDGTKGAGVELGVSLHDVEGALGREGVVVVMDAGDDLFFFGIRVGGDGEVRSFGGCMDGLGGWCAWERDGRWVDVGFGLGVGEVSRSGGRIHECDGGGTELCSGGDDFDAIAEDGGVGGRHVVVVWKCW